MGMFTRRRDQGLPGHPTQFAPRDRAEPERTTLEGSPLTWPKIEQYAAANDHNLAHLRVLSLSDDPVIRLQVASNRHTPDHTLENLAASSDDTIRYAVAANESTPARTLLSMSRDDDDYLVFEVLANPSTPQTILEEHADSPVWMLREAVASNPNCPVATMRLLAHDSEGAVTTALLRNKSLDQGVLITLAERLDEEDSYYNDLITRHPNWPYPGSRTPEPYDFNEDEEARST